MDSHSIKINKLTSKLNSPQRKTERSRKVDLLYLLALALCFLAPTFFVYTNQFLNEQNKQTNLREKNTTLTQLDHMMIRLNECKTRLNENELPMNSKITPELESLQDFLMRIEQSVKDNRFSELNSLSFQVKEIEELIQKFSSKNCNKNTVGSIENPAESCCKLPQNSLSGEYWITGSGDSPIPVYCISNPQNCHCNTTGGWMKVADIDMTDTYQNCPDGFKVINRIESPLRTCGRTNSLKRCASTIFPVHGIKYSHVCGRIIGYQVGSPDAFYPFLNLKQLIDGYYINGISLTHGQSPRQHIWSFAGAVGESYHGGDDSLCPCVNNRESASNIIPPFVGNDYFCDTALRGYNFSDGFFYQKDPLWDGQGCGSTSSCCEFNKAPWFCKQLLYTTADDIELRICNEEDASIDDTPFEIVEVYVH